MLPTRLRHFWICKKSPGNRGKHAGAQQRDYGLQLWWPVSNSGVTGFSVQGLQRPPYTLPRHRLLTCASTYAFTTTLNHRRNCCYVSQHYSSHLRLTRQQDVDHLLGGYNRKEHCMTFARTYDFRDSLGGSQCSYLLCVVTTNPGTHYRALARPFYRLVSVFHPLALILFAFTTTGKSTDFEQTLGPGTTINLNALTCCVPIINHTGPVRQIH